jgi:DNA invertase Pin-like site-specific DNA recombinase
MRAALYLRVSTTDQTTANQERELRTAAKRMRHSVIEIYALRPLAPLMPLSDGRPEFDRLPRSASQRASW